MFAKCVKYTPLLIVEAYYCMVTTGWREGEKRVAGTTKAASFEADGTKREEKEFYLRNTIRHDCGQGRVDRSSFPKHRMATC